MLRGIDADPAELGCSGCQCVQRYTYAWHDHTTDILFLIIDNGDGGCSSHIDHNERDRILVQTCHRICHKVRSKLSRIIHHDIQACFYSRSQYHNLFFQDFFCCQLGNIGDLRNNGWNNTALDICFFDVINIQHCLEINGIFQFCLGPHSGKPLNKVCFFVINTSDNNVCVSNINC